MVLMRKLNKSLSDFIDVKFALIFVFLGAFLYFFNVFFIAITDPQGLIYSPFLTAHLDYVSWIRNAILYTSRSIAKLAGTDCYVLDAYTLKSYHRAFVTVAFPCLGYGVTSFWVAFIIAQTDTWKRKIFWSLTGSIALWFINCCRIALLLVAYDKKWQVNRFVDHHTLFNIAAYILILLMMYLYYKRSSIPNTNVLFKHDNSNHQSLVLAAKVGSVS